MQVQVLCKSPKYLQYLVNGSCNLYSSMSPCRSQNQMKIEFKNRTDLDDYYLLHFSNSRHQQVDSHYLLTEQVDASLSGVRVWPPYTVVGTVLFNSQESRIQQVGIYIYVYLRSEPEIHRQQLCVDCVVCTLYLWNLRGIHIGTKIFSPYSITYKNQIIYSLTEESEVSVSLF